MFSKLDANSGFWQIPLEENSRLLTTFVTPHGQYYFNYLLEFRVSQKSSKGKWKPIAYASRSMSDTEKRYAQIEKEALSLKWACGKFQDYILGSKFYIETDHKPLLPLLSSKHLDTLPSRIVCIRLQLARYDYAIEHVLGKLHALHCGQVVKSTLESTGPRRFFSERGGNLH